MGRNGFNLDELDRYSNDVLNDIIKMFPQESKKFLNRQGGKLRTKAKAIARKKIKKKSTSKNGYINRIKKGKAYISRKTKSPTVRAYGTAPHTHLLEKGHNIHIPIRVGKNKYKIKKTGKKTKALNIFKEAEENYKSTFEREAKQFFEELVSHLGD